MAAAVATVGPSQGLIVLSCVHSTLSSDVITKILKGFAVESDTEQEPEAYPSTSFFANNHIDCYDLRLNNKYYWTVISLFDVKDQKSVDKQFFECVNGIIVYFEPNQDSSFACVQSCLPFISQFNNEIKLLVCESIDENKAEPQKIHEWCIENEFELIELNANDESAEDPFDQLDGIVRLKQAIQAHTWPDIHLKEGPQYKPSPKFREMIDNDVFNSINEAKEVQKQFDSQNQEMNDINKDIEDIDNFEDLFSQFSQLKAKSSQLSDCERKQFAEQVTLAFWKAVGGDSDEIEGINDLEQDLKQLNVE